ncbi:glycosyltransferase [Isoptericola sediminis]|uniref:Glycosyltransferase n=1 Tax=Isoptericola sediminis TaxID=2733572 RepID=A0A849K805_9MICO|nr:glycosyltransferase [Isoptericola sediminis]NNU27905.1 glycosyltransferase [Isoptericola sediminis]
MHVANVLSVLDMPDRRALYLEGSAAEDADRAVVAPDGTVVVPAGTSQGFATYFGAFPASYWVRWTGTTVARLELSLEGAGTVRVSRSAPDGSSAVVATEPVAAELAIDVDVRDAADGGWLWFEVEATDEVRVRSGRWLVDVAPRREGRVSLAITTVNKPDFCHATLSAIAGSPALREVVDTVYVIDQGSDKVVDHPRHAEVARALGDQLTVIDQGNFGGSGGFSRGMLETLESGADAVMLMDDDVTVDPEALLRAVRFHRSAVDPVIVGGHMLDYYAPTVLHAFSEHVDQRHFMWGSVVREQERHDLATAPLRDTPWLHARADGDFNGWWMCLVPTTVLREVGLSLPFFIKWDDAEYCLRAGEAGFPTVSLPGAALWHVAWVDKDDTVEWQARLHTRNRVVTALLHARRPRGGTMLLDLLATDLKLLLGMRYYPVDLHVRALHEVLDGPLQLHQELERTVADARAIGTEYVETVRHGPGDEVFDAPDRAAGGQPVAPKPEGRARQAWFALRSISRTLRPVSAADRRRPSAVLQRSEAAWWEVPRHDSVLVLSGDGGSGTWLRRDVRTFWRLLVATSVAHLRLALRWRSTAARWRAAAPELASVEAWRRTFGR